MIVTLDGDVEKRTCHREHSTGNTRRGKEVPACAEWYTDHNVIDTRRDLSSPTSVFRHVLIDEGFFSKNLW